ncbi:MAG: hypothetical protein H0T84_09475 [Tatlockia sp.]|nr:hypothetical protein [Tatlockia sp.]
MQSKVELEELFIKELNINKSLVKNSLLSKNSLFSKWGIYYSGFERSIDDNAAEVLSTILNKNEFKDINIFHLCFMSELTDKGVILLANSLKNNQKLTTFGMQGINSMTDLGLKAIADMIVSCPNLEVVWLAKPSQITKEGAIYLAEKVHQLEIEKGKALKEMDFYEGLPKDVVNAYRDSLREFQTKVETTLNY